LSPSFGSGAPGREIDDDSARGRRLQSTQPVQMAFKQAQAEDMRCGIRATASIQTIHRSSLLFGALRGVASRILAMTMSRSSFGTRR